MAGFAWVGSAFAALLFFVTGDDWQLGAVAVVVANICLGASRSSSTTRSCATIATEDERDRVSSRGWAFGYLGGGLLLALNLALVTLHDTVGISEGFAVRVSMLRPRCGGPASP